jgi:ornithine cyclodeaminase/alanine dehydrogenase-like protein (mu-crystallin family)
LAVRKADLIVCDDIEQAKIECGELMQAAETGDFVWDSAVRLDTIVAGLKASRLSDSDITLFESQGVAFEDLAVCARLYELALEQGIGTRLPD